MLTLATESGNSLQAEQGGLILLEGSSADAIVLTLAVSGADLTVSWSAVTGAASYRYSTDGGATWTTTTSPITITGGATKRLSIIVQALDAGSNIIAQGNTGWRLGQGGAGAMIALAL